MTLNGKMPTLLQLYLSAVCSPQPAKHKGRKHHPRDPGTHGQPHVNKRNLNASTCAMNAAGLLIQVTMKEESHATPLTPGAGVEQCENSLRAVASESQPGHLGQVYSSVDDTDTAHLL